jgi:hypothetical protein
MKVPCADTLANKIASQKLSCASEDMESWATGCADVLVFGESRLDIFKSEERRPGLTPRGPREDDRRLSNNRGIERRASAREHTGAQIGIYC